MGNQGQAENKAERVLEAFDLRCRGMTYREIGARLGVSHVSAYRYVREHLDALAEQTHEKAEQLRCIEHRRLEKLYRVCMEGIVGCAADDGNRMRWVEQARKVSESIRKLWGIDSPTTVLHGESPEYPISDADVIKRLDDWLAEESVH